MKKLLLLSCLALMGCVEFEVIGQSSDGTLVRTSDFKRYLIEYNEEDSARYDDDHFFVWLGSIEDAGTYQYKTVLGNIATIRKLRRVDD